MENENKVVWLLDTKHLQASPILPWAYLCIQKFLAGATNSQKESIIAWVIFPKSFLFEQ